MVLIGEKLSNSFLLNTVLTEKKTGVKFDWHEGKFYVSPCNAVLNGAAVLY